MLQYVVHVRIDGVCGVGLDDSTLCRYEPEAFNPVDETVDQEQVSLGASAMGGPDATFGSDDPSMRQSRYEEEEEEEEIPGAEGFEADHLTRRTVKVGLCSALCPFSFVLLLASVHLPLLHPPCFFASCVRIHAYYIVFCPQYFMVVQPVLTCFCCVCVSDDQLTPSGIRECG